MKLDIHIDGGSRGNPGPAAAGVVVRIAEPPKLLREAGYYLGRATNNVAEYTALIKAVELATSLGADEVRIASDSELLVKQITGDYRVKSPDLLPLFKKAQALLLKIDAWHVRYVPREQNRRADELVNLALDAGRDVSPASPGRAAEDTPRVRAAVQSTRAAASAPPGAGRAPAAVDWPERLVPTWSVVVTAEPGPACPAGLQSGARFSLGPTTPAGLCLFAAQAVLDELPLRAPQDAVEAGSTACDRCGVAIRIEKGK